jgi:hypothetical protein
METIDNILQKHELGDFTMSNSMYLKTVAVVLTLSAISLAAAPNDVLDWR